MSSAGVGLQNCNREEEVFIKTKKPSSGSHNDIRITAGFEGYSHPHDFYGRIQTRVQIRRVVVMFQSVKRVKRVSGRNLIPRVPEEVQFLEGIFSLKSKNYLPGFHPRYGIADIFCRLCGFFYGVSVAVIATW